jgi:hypothetical protein
MRRFSFNLPFVAMTLCMALSVIAGLLILHGSDDQSRHVTVLGKRVELTASQTRAASHSVGVTGPNLDALQPSYSKVLNAVKNGVNGPDGDMPNGMASGPDLYAVAQYVSRVANRGAYHP